MHFDVKTKLISSQLVREIPTIPLDPPRPRLEASEKLHIPIGLFKTHVHTSLCGREMASEPNILKRDGGAYPKSEVHSQTLFHPLEHLDGPFRLRRLGQSLHTDGGGVLATGVES